jgi:hypothetical protein
MRDSFFPLVGRVVDPERVNGGGGAPANLDTITITMRVWS